MAWRWRESTSTLQPRVGGDRAHRAEQRCPRPGELGRLYVRPGREGLADRPRHRFEDAVLRRLASRARSGSSARARSTSAARWGWPFNHDGGDHAFRPERRGLREHHGQGARAVGRHRSECSDDTHHEGHSVIAGFVYRGSSLPQLAGRYVFGDFARLFRFPAGPNDSGRLFYLSAPRVARGSDRHRRDSSVIGLFAGLDFDRCLGKTESLA
jgi:hypothetical protein